MDDKKFNKCADYWIIDNDKTNSSTIDLTPKYHIFENQKLFYFVFLYKMKLDILCIDVYCVIYSFMVHHL